jgi:hypothetical protein
MPGASPKADTVFVRNPLMSALPSDCSKLREITDEMRWLTRIHVPAAKESTRIAAAYASRRIHESLLFAMLRT